MKKEFIPMLANLGSQKYNPGNLGNGDCKCGGKHNLEESAHLEAFLKELTELIFKHDGIIVLFSAAIEHDVVSGVFGTGSMNDIEKLVVACEDVGQKALAKTAPQLLLKNLQGGDEVTDEEDDKW